MSLKEISHKHEFLYRKIKVISNRLRFKIVEIAQQDEFNITELSSKLKLSYTKCADYVTILQKYGLIQKIKQGKEIKVKSRVRLFENKIEFL